MPPQRIMNIKCTTPWIHNYIGSSVFWNINQSLLSSFEIGFTEPTISPNSYLKKDFNFDLQMKISSININEIILATQNHGEYIFHLLLAVSGSCSNLSTSYYILSMYLTWSNYFISCVKWHVSFLYTILQKTVSQTLSEEEELFQSH